ncbi:MAG: ABC transporter ATP-binding protein [Oenococcus sp.]|uniref:ABC transporter transmembrane domain-containing protein n=1 Tax=Oenococcus TaxID=46254 RepID=UPI0021E73193|nr:ABC transporter ATP-binding protein [Oenococcus kitaharae]MCV3296784.1 ABC transporter ATP-binding protein/permease [Oenococcus kitaharae]
MLGKFLSFSKKYSLLLLFLIPIASFVEISVASILQLLTDAANGRAHITYGLLVLLVLAYIVVDALFYFFSSYFREKWLNLTAAAVRASLMRKYLSEQQALALSHDDNESSSFNQLTNNMAVLQDDYLRAAVSIYAELCQFIIAMAISLFIQPMLCLVVLVLCLPGLLIPLLNQKLLKASKKDVLASSEKYTQILRNILDGLRTIQLFNVNQIMRHLFDRQNQDWLVKQNKDQKNRKLIGSLSQLLDNFLYLGTWVGGIYFVMNKSISLGQLVAFSQLMIFIAEPLQSASGLMADYVGGQEPAKKIQANFASEEKIPAGHAINKLKSIAYQDIVYTKKDQTILRHINFKFETDKHYLIFGKTGSGKTSLMNLPLLDKNGYTGKILINGHDQKNIDLASLRARLDVAEQSGAIFSASFQDNLSLFRQKFSKSQLQSALTQAQLSNYANDEAFAKQLSSSGHELSGGEAKRLFIARTLLDHFDYLLFDEPASGLDPHTAQAIEEMLMQLDSGWTVITHHYNEALFAFADQILVMADGKIAVSGQLQEPTIQASLMRLNLLKP